jgi:hypothetical protein
VRGVVSPLPEPVDPQSVTQVLVGGQWLGVVPGTFRIGTLRLGAGSSGESIRNEIWFSAQLVDGGRCSGPFAALEAVKHS